MRLPFTDRQKRLNKQLVAAAKAGKRALVESLLDEGAEINQSGLNGPLFCAAYATDSANYHAVIHLLLERGATVDITNSIDCTPLMGAANKGNVGSARILLAAGANPYRFGSGKDAFGWAVISTHQETIALFQEKLAEKNRPPPRIEGEDEITTLRALGNRTLEEVFNFRARERISLVRNGPEGPVEAFTRESFDVVADRDSLRAAYRQYRDKGGQLPETHVFPQDMAKPALGRRNGLS